MADQARTSNGHAAGPPETAGPDTAAVDRTPPGEREPAEHPATRFNPGDLIAGRYRVVRFVAEGGMGEVYEVEDLTLAGRLALKTIRPEIGSDPLALDRFKREINVARRVTHPNVSRVYDVGVHHDGRETIFLTMEFLAGETLRDLLVRRGRLSEAEALPLVEQMAQGLAAAHEAGVIHRDFKSANVMLVAGSGSRPLRAVVTDFGLARPEQHDEGLASISDAGAVVGTPAYMAPEQVEGRRVTTAADIYSFGIVLYEMVTGRRPFSGDTPLSLAVKRLTETPKPPREIDATVSPAWDACILRCLERDPTRRFGTATDVVAALTSGAGGTRQAVDAPTVALAEPVVARRRARPSLLIAAAAFAVLAGAFALWRFVPGLDRRPPAVAQAAPAVAIRPAVAVLGLHDNSRRAETSWLAEAVAEMLATELSAGGKVRVIPPAEVSRARSDLGIGDGSSLTAGMLARIRRRLDADSFVVGSYTLVGDPSPLIRLDLRVVDAATGKATAEASASGTDTQLFDLVSRAGARVRQQLGLGDVTAGEALALQASIPSNAVALRFYSEGISKLRALEPSAAVPLLVKAVEADSRHPLIHAALSEAYASLGNDPLAKESGARSVALAEKLGRDQKLQIEAAFQKAAKDWPKAIEAEKALFGMYPDNVEYGLKLADSQISGGSTNEALVTIEALRKLPARGSSDGRIDLVEARARQEAGDFARQKALAVSAVAKGRSSGARLVVARARMLEATAALALGELKGATSAIDEARRLFEASGDRSGVARALEQTALIVGRQGDLSGEYNLLQQAASIHRDVGDASSVARVLSNTGKVLYLQGRNAEAETYFDEALRTFRQVGAKFSAAVTLNNVGAMMFSRGDLPAAQNRLSQALALFNEIGDKWGTAMSLTNIGEVLECRGDLEQATRMHEESLALNRAAGEKGGAAYDLFRLGGIDSLRGNLVAARDHYREALAIQTEIGDRLGAAESKAALAALQIPDGNAVQAQKDAAESEEILRTEGAVERSPLALSTVAQSLQAQGKSAEALAVASDAWQQASRLEDRRVRFSVAAVYARARAASKNPADVDAAIRFLEAERAQASKLLFTVSELELRLAAGEIELAAKRAAARQHLSALAKDASAKGFISIARRAAAGAA